MLAEMCQKELRIAFRGCICLLLLVETELIQSVEVSADLIKVGYK